MVTENRSGSRHERPGRLSPPQLPPTSQSENQSNRRQAAAGRLYNLTHNLTEEAYAMSCLKWIKTLAIVLIATVPLLFAGDSGKCKYSTQDCLDHMASKMKTSGWVGVELEHNEDTGALTVSKVVPGSPAEGAGIQPGDQLFALNGVEINDKNDEALAKARADWKPGQSVNYTIKRDGQERHVSLTLGQMPADVLARFVGQHMLEHASSAMAAK